MNGVDVSFGIHHMASAVIVLEDAKRKLMKLTKRRKPKRELKIVKEVYGIL